MYAYDFSMILVRRNQNVEKLALKTVNQMKALMSVLGRNIGVGFKRRRCHRDNSKPTRT